MNDLNDKCQETLERITEWRDCPDAFDLISDRMYLRDLIQDLQDDARKQGYQCELLKDPNIEQAFNAVADIIAWEQSTTETDTLPTPQTIKEWYTPNELAELHGKAAFTVRQWCNNARIECEKDDDTNKWRIPGHEVKRLVNGGTLAPKPKH